MKKLFLFLFVFLGLTVFVQAKPINSFNKEAVTDIAIDMQFTNQSEGDCFKETESTTIIRDENGEIISVEVTIILEKIPCP